MKPKDDILPDSTGEPEDPIENQPKDWEAEDDEIDGAKPDISEIDQDLE